MPLDNSDSPQSSYYCYSCIGEALLSKEIKDNGKRRRCSYCTKNKKSVSLEKLAERIDEVYKEIVCFGETITIYDDNDHSEHLQQGDPPSEIISQMIECVDTRIGEEICQYLEDFYSFAVARDGEDNWYDETSNYTIEIPKDYSHHEKWSDFSNSVRHRRRFLNTQASTLLEELIGPVLREEWPHNTSAIISISAEDNFYLYRARQANTSNTKKSILASPRKELGAPPPSLNMAGRMNPAGITVFYGCLDPLTTLAEIRVPVGGRAIIGKFQVIRTIRLLDLTKLDTSNAYLSYFEDSYVQKHGYKNFLRKFHSIIKKPVIPGEEALEYLPTQFLAEFLATHQAPPIDGLVFGSSQQSSNSKNIVLFANSCLVEGASNEQLLNIQDAFEEEEDGTEIFTHPPLSPTPAPTFLTNEIPTLRLLVDEISTYTVAGISYEAIQTTVQYSIQEPTPAAATNFNDDLAMDF